MTYFLGITDEIKIEVEEDGFMLAIYTDDGRTHRYRIGLPDQFHAEVERTIGAWLAEGKAARVTMPDLDTLREHGYTLVDEGGHAVYGDPDLARDIERGK